MAESADQSLPDRRIGKDHDRVSPTEFSPPYDERPPVRRDWRHELSNLQWLGLVLGITAAIAAAMAVIAIGVDQLLLAIHRITTR